MRTEIGGTVISEERAANEIIEVCKLLHEKNMLAAADGNVSYRLSDSRILITPSGQHKAFLEAHELSVIDLKNNILSGSPSSERLMHLEIYKSCPLATCVVHAHPPTATAWTVARPFMDKLPAGAMPEVTLAVGEIPIVPYARPSTPEMGINLRKYLPKHRVMILARHGAVTWGESLVEAYSGMERLEHAAQILHLAFTLGRLSNLPQEEILALQEMRKTRGERVL